MSAQDKKESAEAYQEQRRLRYLAWEGRYYFCSCGAHAVPLRRYFKMFLCVCGGMIR